MFGCLSDTDSRVAATNRQMPSPSSSPASSSPSLSSSSLSSSEPDSPSSKLARASYAAAVCWLVWVAGLTTTLIIIATARSSDELRLHAADLWNQGPLLGAMPNFFVYLIAGHNMGLTPHHLLGVERGEARLAKQRAAKEAGSAKGLTATMPIAVDQVKV